MKEEKYMKKLLSFIALFAIVCSFSALAQDKVTGFSNLKLYIDPGHYQTYNLGYGGYSEAEKSLQVAYALKEYMTTYTDMPEANIKFSRLTDNDTELAFQTKADQSYAMRASFFYSIHSDAPSVISAATVFLYGGRRLTSGATPIEKLPEGGKLFGDILNGDLTGVLRTIRSDGTVKPDASRGNINDLVFYSYTAPSTQLVPYLAVNRTTTGSSPTPSIVSEAGFHTNPTQNMQFVNVEHKRMQAYAAYQSLVRYLSEKELGARKDPVQVGIATGFVFDKETYRPVNGAKITVTESGKTPKVYTTDTYASLPKKYNFKSDEFGNGFYWLEGFTPGATVDIKVEATGFETQQTTLTIPATVGATTIQGLGVKDFQMVNTMPAKVVDVVVKNDLSGNVIPRYPLDIVFSRKMNKTSVENAFSLNPAADVTFSWPNEFTLRVDISKVQFETTYTITIDGSKAKNSETDQFLDGAGTGTAGSNYVKNFTTSDLDSDPPKIVSWDPQGTQEESLRPIVRIEFDEPLNKLSFGHTPITVTDENGTTVEGSYSYYATVNFKSVMHFIFSEDLKPQVKYTVTLAAGIEDMYGNAAEEFSFDFTARPREKALTAVLYDFNNTVGSGWTAPTYSGSTLGVVPTISQMVADAQVRAVAESSGSVRLDYQWDVKASGWRMRIHNTLTDPKFSKNNFVQLYLFGNGSQDKFAVALRNGGTGSFWTNVPIVMDWVGWKLITWDLSNDPYDNWTELGTAAGAMPTGNDLNLSAFRIEVAPADRRFFELSSIYFSQLRVVKLGDELPPYTSIPNVKTEGIDVVAADNVIKVTAAEAISDIRVYSIAGALVKSAQPVQTSYEILIGDLAKGVYIVRVTTGILQKNVKVIVK